MITLYSRPLCPHCAKVRRKLDELELDYEIRRASFFPPLRRKVRAISGQSRVPVIVDPSHGIEGMNESDDIVRYLERTYGPS
ncbi:MAG: glutathione S-transferase N-terminal domain-containing protein [Halobacteriota archaeon]